MGHKYSKIFSHNTDSNYQQQQYKFPVIAEKINDKLYPDSHLTFSHYYPVKCKLCFQSVYHQPTLILNCRLKHRYHPECVAKHRQRLKNLSNTREDRMYLNCEECSAFFKLSLNGFA
jgi:hypothetical protein